MINQLLTWKIIKDLGPVNIQIPVWNPIQLVHFHELHEVLSSTETCFGFFYKTKIMFECLTFEETPHCK